MVEPMVTSSDARDETRPQGGSDRVSSDQSGGVRLTAALRTSSVARRADRASVRSQRSWRAIHASARCSLDASSPWAAPLGPSLARAFVHKIVVSLTLRVITLSVVTVKDGDGCHNRRVRGDTRRAADHAATPAGGSTTSPGGPASPSTPSATTSARASSRRPSGPAGRKLYGPEHLERLARIRELQARRFSLAAIRALLDAERPGLVEGIFSGAGRGAYYARRARRAIGRRPPSSPTSSATAGLLRDPHEFGRDAYDGADLDVLRGGGRAAAPRHPRRRARRARAHLRRGRRGDRSAQVVELFTGEARLEWDADELDAFQHTAAVHASTILPLVAPPRRLRAPAHAAAPHARCDRATPTPRRAEVDADAPSDELDAQSSRCQMRAALPPVIFARSSAGMWPIVSSMTLREYGQSLPWCG